MTTTAADETRLEGQGTQPADVTGATAELEDLSRWLDDDATQDAEEQNPTPEETESDATTTEDEADPELEAAVQARAERLAEEKAEQVRTEERQRQETERQVAESQRQWQAVEQSFKTRAPRLRSHLEAVIRGEAELNVDGILNEFVSHHAQASNVRDAEWYDYFYQQTINALPEGERQRIESLKARGELPVTKLLEERDRAVTGKAKEGLHPESRLKEEHAKGALAYRSRLEKMLKDDPTGQSVLSLLQSRGQPAASRGTRAATPPARNNFDPETASMADVDRMLAQAGV